MSDQPVTDDEVLDGHLMRLQFGLAELAALKNELQFGDLGQRIRDCLKDIKKEGE